MPASPEGFLNNVGLDFHSRGRSDLIDDFNLLISTSRGNERNACSEMWYLLGELGDRGALVDRTPVLGLVAAKTKIQPIEAVQRLRGLLRERPWEFRYVLRVIPIMSVVRADAEEIEKAALQLASLIGVEEKFRITVEKRHTALSSKSLIEAIAGKIDRRVDLENPDKILLIEIVGLLAGVSLIRPSDILSVEKEKRSARAA